MTKIRVQTAKSRLYLSFAASLLASAATFSNVAVAGAWVPGEGTGYVKLGQADYEASKFRGNNDSFKDFSSTNTSLYAEHGLGNKFAIYGSLLYQSFEQTDINNHTSSASGFSDTELGVRYQWQAAPFVMSTSFLVKLPYLYDEDDAVPLGSGQEDYELKVLIGNGLGNLGYWNAEMGYRLRTGSYSDEYRYLLEYGFDVNKNLYLRAKLDGILSANNADTVPFSDANLSITPEYDSGKMELTAGWNFDKNSQLNNWGVEFTYTREIYGDNILQGNSYQLGITKVY